MCAKTISSLVRNALRIAKSIMSPVTVWGAAAWQPVSLVSIMKASHFARVSTPARHYFQYVTTI